jgi:hypothetical protein
MALYNIPNKTPATLIASFEAWTRIHLQVRDASTVYIRNKRNDLELPGPGGQQGGLSLNLASGVVSIPWIGPLYMFGSNPNSLIEVAIFPSGVDIGR